MTKTLCVKDWFASKKANEMNRRRYTSEIFCYLQETEKAIKVMCASDGSGIMTYWCPKSQIEEYSYEDGEERVRDLTNVPSYNSYEEAKKAYDEYMQDYR